ncbi:MAG TPA: lipid II flippase MurJ, partial [Candidatus Dojkabacteria bacterium]|nr:lipid II flippase MurJ [Candidatus Dojkabacteria bacterium]
MVKRTLISLKNLLVKEQNEILGAASMLMALLFISKVTGLVFLTLMSKQFGASQETDLFYLASAIPETITNIILLGAISGSVIPIFVKVRQEKGEQHFISSFSSMINVGMLFFVILAVIAAIFSRQLIPFAIQLVQRNIPLTGAEIDMTVWMMRLLLIPQIILGLSAFISTWLNIYHRFIIPSLAPVFYNIGKILGILIFVPLMGGSIWGIILGTILGAILHLVIQIPLVIYLRLSFKFKIAFKDENFRQVLKL